MTEVEMKTVEDWVPVALPIPEEWAYVDFEDAFEILSTSNIKTPESQYLPFGTFPIVDQGKKLIGGYTNFQDRMINEKGSVIVFGDHTRCFKLIDFPFAPGADGTKVLQPYRYLDPKFAYYGCLALRLPDRGYSRHYSFLKKGKFPIAPWSEQLRVVAKIEQLFSELDKGVETLAVAREQLNAYRQSVLKNAFEGRLTADWRKGRKPTVADDNIEPIPSEEADALPALPEGWRYARLGSFIRSMEAGKSFRCEERTPAATEIGVAKVSAVTWGAYDENESKTCTDPKKINAGYFIKEGDFLFSRANTIELVGACVIAKEVRRRVMLSDKTLRIVFSGLPPSYALHYLRSRLGRREIMRRSTGNQESMRNIGQERIKSIILPVCPPDEAEHIESTIENILASVDHAERDIDAQLAKSDALRRAILKRAFSGKLVTQNPTDEPASKLLTRLPAEQEKRITTGRRNNKNSKKEAA